MDHLASVLHQTHIPKSEALRLPAVADEIPYSLPRVELTLESSLQLGLLELEPLQKLLREVPNIDVVRQLPRE